MIHFFVYVPCTSENGERKGGKYLGTGGEEEQRRKRRKIFGEGKYLVHGGEKEQRQKRRNIFGEVKYLEKENIWSAKEKRMEKENEEIIKRRKIDGDIEGPTNWVDVVQSAFSNVRQ